MQGREERARHFGRRLKEFRERRALSQDRLAEKAEVSRNVVAKAEVGISLPYPRNRRKLADALDKDVEEFWD